MKSKTQDPNHTTLAGERQLDEYVLEHSDDEPEYLYRLWRATNVHLLHGRMASGRLQGRLLKMFVEMIRPKNILEVGTFSGYSALCMAEGLRNVNVNGNGNGDWNGNGGKIYTFEINDEQEPFTRKWIEESPWAEYVTFIIGDVAELADNTLWDGHVIDPEYDRDHQTQGIRRFNDHIKNDPRVSRVILPLRDGLTIIRVHNS